MATGNWARTGRDRSRPVRKSVARVDTALGQLALASKTHHTSVVTLKSMTPAKHATFAVPGVVNTIFHASDTGVTTELQFDNAIQVEWFDTTLSESYFGLKAQSIDNSIFIQQGGHS